MRPLVEVCSAAIPLVPVVVASSEQTQAVELADSSVVVALVGVAKADPYPPQTSQRVAVSLVSQVSHHQLSRNRSKNPKQHLFSVALLAHPLNPKPQAASPKTKHSQVVLVPNRKGKHQMAVPLTRALSRVSSDQEPVHPVYLAWRLLQPINRTRKVYLGHWRWVIRGLLSNSPLPNFLDFKNSKHPQPKLKSSRPHYLQMSINLHKNLLEAVCLRRKKKKRKMAISKITNNKTGPK